MCLSFVSCIIFYPHSFSHSSSSSSPLPPPPLPPFPSPSLFSQWFIMWLPRCPPTRQTLTAATRNCTLATTLSRWSTMTLHSRTPLEPSRSGLVRSWASCTHTRLSVFSMLLPPPSASSLLLPPSPSLGAVQLCGGGGRASPRKHEQSLYRSQERCVSHAWLVSS